MNQIKIWRDDLRANNKVYSVSVKMAIRNKITALISREKNREKIHFLERLITDKDLLIQGGIQIITKTIAKHPESNQIFKELNESLAQTLE